jgi:hypothetical protein
MRGDSLRDFYAKTIALCGLGLLAGAGALVDYWPTAIEFPSVGPALVLPELAQAIPPPALDRPGPVVRVSSVRSVDVARRQPAIPSFDMIPASPASFGVAVRLGEPPAVSFALATNHVAVGEDVALSMPEANLYTVGIETASLIPGPDADNDGLITGAFKKTGASLARTGVKTVDIVKAGFSTVSSTLSGAVRHVIPDFN